MTGNVKIDGLRPLEASEQDPEPWRRCGWTAGLAGRRTRPRSSSWRGALTSPRRGSSWPRASTSVRSAPDHRSEAPERGRGGRGAGGDPRSRGGAAASVGAATGRRAGSSSARSSSIRSASWSGSTGWQTSYSSGGVSSPRRAEHDGASGAGAAGDLWAPRPELRRGDGAPGGRPVQPSGSRISRALAAELSRLACRRGGEAPHGAGRAGCPDRSARGHGSDSRRPGSALRASRPKSPGSGADECG